MKLCYWMYAGPAHIGTLRVASSFKNVHAVMHAPLGDDYFNVMRAMLERERDFTPATQTVVDRHVLARGSQEKVIDTIIRKSQEDVPDLILVTPTCTSSILQEDLHMFAERATDTTDCPVLLADVNHYRYNEFQATDRVLAQLVRYFVPPPHVGVIPEKTPTPSVNIIGALGLGFHQQHDLNELVRLLRQLHIDVNMMIPKSANSKGSTHELPQVTRAWCNVCVYRETGELTAEYLSNEWDMPYMSIPPQGLSYLTEFVKELAKLISERGDYFQLTCQQFAASTPDGRALRAWYGNHSPDTVSELPVPQNAPEWCGPQILHLGPHVYDAFLLKQRQQACAGSWFVHTIDCQNLVRKKAFVFGDATHAAAMTRFLREDMGITVIAAGTFCKHDETWFRNAVEGFAETVFLTEDNTRVSTLIAHLQPDGIFGTQMERHIGKRLGIPCSVISAPVHIQNFNLGYTPFLGYEGVNHMADLIYNTFALGMEDHLLDMFGGHDPDDIQENTDLALNGGSGTHTASTVIWSESAQTLLKAIPPFVRTRVRENTVAYAVSQNVHEITPSLLMEAKKYAEKTAASKS